jgi:cell division protease FtsH
MLFLGRDMMHHNEYSNETAKKIDQEVANIINNAYQRATKTIKENKDKLEKIALYLLERESLSSDDINEILAGNDLKPIVDEEKPKKKKKTTEEDDDNGEAITADTDDSESEAENRN